MENCLTERLEEHIALCGAIRDFSTYYPREAFQMLRLCMTQKATYLNRALPHSDVKMTYIRDTDAENAKTLAHIISRGHEDMLTDIQELQASLPIKLGGMGILRNEPVEAAARLASELEAVGKIRGFREGKTVTDCCARSDAGRARRERFRDTERGTFKKY